MICDLPILLQRVKNDSEQKTYCNTILLYSVDPTVSATVGEDLVLIYVSRNDIVKLVYSPILMGGKLSRTIT